jgi:hypothetical protein
MSESDTDPASEPIRTAETTVAAYRWDQWRAAAHGASERARRVALAVSVGLGAVAGAAGLVWLPGDSRASVALYVPLLAWAAWSWTRSTMADRGIRDALEGIRDVVVPALVDGVEDATLVSLLRNGGGLVTSRSTVIASHRRDSLVALVASEYDPRSLPPAVGSTYSGGP